MVHDLRPAMSGNPEAHDLLGHGSAGRTLFAFKSDRTDNVESERYVSIAPDMKYADAEAAYAEAIREQSYELRKSIEDDPTFHNDDSAQTLHAKALRQWLIWNGLYGGA